MRSIGPTLPSSPSGKRKRGEDISNEKDQDPTPGSSHGQSLIPEASSKKPRTIGPTLPPASLDERPQTDPASASEVSSDEDDFGPALPKANTASQHNKPAVQNANRPAEPQLPAKSVRDEWMIVPPSNSDWSSRVDPTKLRNRKFNTGRGAKGSDQVASNGDDHKWTETPDEKKTRLQREMMGMKDNGRPRDRLVEDSNEAATTQKLREYNEKARGPSLYKDHQKTNPHEKEDDPSARAFDREKDIAGGVKISTSQRRELMKKASNFGSRFSSAKYL